MVMITVLTKLMITMVTEMMMMTISRIRLKKQIFISKAGAIYLGIVMTSCTYHCSDHHHPHDHLNRHHHMSILIITIFFII